MKISEDVFMICEEDIFKKLRIEYATIHLFRNCYLMRNNTWSTMCPSTWGIVKVIKTQNEENEHHRFKF